MAELDDLQVDEYEALEKVVVEDQVDEAVLGVAADALVGAGAWLPSSMSELAFRADELGDLTLTPRSALIIENEVTYLSVDVPDHGVVLWGKGFDVDKVGRLPWLTDIAVDYWSDLDTHGFAILDRLHAWLPQRRSVLMDRETLMAHRGRWVVED